MGVKGPPARTAVRVDPQTLPTVRLVLAGAGNNGGGGLVTARHLANRGVAVAVLLTTPEEGFTGVPGRQVAALKGTAAELVHEPAAADLVIDAMVGYGLRGPLEEAVLPSWPAGRWTWAPRYLRLTSPAGSTSTEGAARRCPSRRLPR